MSSVSQTIGQTERHNVYVTVSAWTGKMKVLVDEQPVVISAVFSRSKSSTFSVGNKEMHEVEVRVSGILIPKIEIWVDRKMLSNS